MKRLHVKTPSKIVLVVADGLGGLPMQAGGMTELESAKTPNLDGLASEGTNGLLHPIARGITCGSGPGHLALFGYDPVEFNVGRGVLSALGIGFDLQPGDVAARGNFCTLGSDGKVSDRRAGRIADERGKRLVEKLQGIEIENAEVIVRHVKEYRFVVIIRGDDLGDAIEDTDPRATDAEPRQPTARDEASKRTQRLVESFIDQVRERLDDESPANMVLLRGFARRPQIPSLSELFGLDPCAIAIYPMYRGLSRLLGMTVPEKPTCMDHQVEQIKQHWNDHDFLFVHHKASDSSGEDGDFDGKVKEIEEVDGMVATIRELEPDCLIVTGDHSTPSKLSNHSWHPVPVVLHSQTCRPDRVRQFGEREAVGGGLGQFRATELMPLALGHAEKLDKFGA